MDKVSVLVSNAVSLIPGYLDKTKGLAINRIYTYHQKTTRNGKPYIYIDQVQKWYPREYFRVHDIPLN